MEERKCNLETINKQGEIECRAICPVHFMTDKCCKYCEEINDCDKICGFVKINKLN